MKSIKTNKLRRIVVVAFIVFLLFSQLSILKAEEVKNTNDANVVTNEIVTIGTVVPNDKLEGIQVDNEYYSVNTGRFVNASQTQSNYYDDGEGNTFAIYIQPTTSIDSDASNYYYEDIYSERMLKVASKSFLETVTSQNSDGQFFNGIDDSKIIELTNSDGDSYPALFWKFSIKFNNANYFFYVYEIIDKNVMYNMTFCATSYNFLENNNIDSVLNSFKIKNYQPFEHKSGGKNIISMFTQNDILSKVVIVLVVIIIVVIIVVVINMKKVDKEEKELEKEELEKELENEHQQDIQQDVQQDTQQVENVEDSDKE